MDSSRYTARKVCGEPPGAEPVTKSLRQGAAEAPHAPGQETIQRLAKALGVPVTELLKVTTGMHRALDCSAARSCARPVCRRIGATLCAGCRGAAK